MIYKFHSELVCDDCSGTFTFRMGRMRSYFIAFFIDQDVPPDPKIVYQNPFAYDKALLFILSIQNLRFGYWVLYQHGAVLVHYYWEILIQFCLPTELCLYQSAFANCQVELKPRFWIRLLLVFKPEDCHFLV